MNVTIPNKKFGGSVDIPESKELVHRWLIVQALAGETDKVDYKNISRDIISTIRCIEGLGLGKSERGPVIGKEICYLDCGESRTTYQLILPIAAALGKTCEFHVGTPSAEVSSKPFYKALKVHGIRNEEKEDGTTLISGKLTGGTYILPGDVSSQYISGLLMAAPLLSITSTFIIQGQLSFFNNIRTTISVLEECGISVSMEEGKGDISCIFKVAGNQKYVLPEKIVMEKDWSIAAYWLCAGALTSGPIVCADMNIDSLQYNMQILEILRQFGAKIDVYRQYAEYKKAEKNRESVTVMGVRLRGIMIDAKEIPSLVPIIALTACKATGITVIKNVTALQKTESGCLKSVRSSLKELGADIREFKNGLIITGPSEEDPLVHRKHFLKGGKVTSCQDHRIAMMSAIASCICDNPVQINNAEIVTKSYPDFFEDLVSLQK